MSTAVSMWAKRLASKHCPSLLASHFKASTIETHHPASTMMNRFFTAVPWHCTIASFYSACRMPVSTWLQPCLGSGLWEPTRCLHTGEGNKDQMTTSVAEQSSSPCSAVSGMVGQVVEQWTKSLKAAQVPEAHLAVEHIVAHVLGIARNDLQMHLTSGTTLTREQLAEVERLVTCRLARMPLQYILGEWDFHHLTLKMVPPVFIPRPETEQLVELAILTLRKLEAPRVLEIGCGSGAISLAILHSLPQVECVAVDQSKHAVELTEANASRLKLNERLTILARKVTTGALPPLPHSSYDLVVSNPPYVLRKDLMDVQPEIMMYEDLRALDGGKDGLEVIKAVLHHAHHLLLPGRTLLLEVDPCHPYLLPAWLEKQQLQLKLLQVHKDFNKQERFMEFIKTP